MIAAAFTLGYLAAHPAWPLIFAACCAFVIAGVLLMRWEDRRDEDARHKAPRPRSPLRAAGAAARAWRRATWDAHLLPVTAATRAAAAVRRWPGAIRRHFEPALDAYDRETLALLPAMRAEDTGGLRALHAPDLGPGAGPFLLSAGYNSPPAQAQGSLKVDSPAPETPPMPGPTHPEMWAHPIDRVRRALADHPGNTTAEFDAITAKVVP